MKIAIEHVGDARVCVMRLAGEIDMASSPEVRSAIEGAINRGCVSIVLDLADVSYADSTALGLVVWTDHMLEPRGGRLVLAGATRNVARILELSGLVDVAPTVSEAPSADEALAGLELGDENEEPLWAQSVALPAESASLSAIRNAVCSMLAPMGIPEASMFDIRVAVGEAVSNAIRHGSPGGESDVVTVEVVAYEDRVVLIVRDTGAGYDGETSGSSDVYATSGRGVLFMRALMDRVEFDRMPDGGTAVTLVKHVDRPTSGR